MRRARCIVCGVGVPASRLVALMRMRSVYVRRDRVLDSMSLSETAACGTIVIQVLQIVVIPILLVAS